MQKYQHLVELMRRERISRQYQQHNDEVALHDARTALVDSDASDSDSDVRTLRTLRTLRTELGTIFFDFGLVF